MPVNRSVPTDIVLPHLAYEDVAAAIVWLSNAFGFREHYRYGDAPDGAQMSFGKDGVIGRRLVDS
jgi:uncharacterized glyoxalase superfamily protein PhnB